MLAETKASLISFAAHSIIEGIIPPLNLEPKEGANLVSAKLLDSDKGDFRGSACEYFTVFTTSSDPEEKARALIGLVQQLVNLGSFKQARELLLDNDPGSFEFDSSEKVLFFQARVQEKLGWIADYELDFRGSERFFRRAADFVLESKLRGDWTDEEQEFYSTSRHFIGRAKYSQAAFGIDRRRNVYEAVGFFQEAMDLDENLANKQVEGKLAFGCSWIARCYMLAGDFRAAGQYIERAENHYNAQMRQTPDRIDYMAHYLTLLGERNLKVGDVASAQLNFVEALNIRKKQRSPYPKGVADAQLGLSTAFWQEGEFPKALHHFKLAIKAHPYSVFRGIIGG